MLLSLLSGWSLALAAVLFVVIWLKLPSVLWCFYRQWKTARGVPGLPPHWLYGNLHQINIDSVTKTSKTETNMFIFSNHYKLTRWWIGYFYVIISVHHPTCVGPLLKHSKDAPLYDNYRPWLGDSILLSDGAKWHRNRKLLTPAFHYSVLKGYVSVYNSCIQTLFDKWTDTTAKGEPVKLFDTISLASFDILLQCAFSYNSNCQHHPPPYLHAVETIPLYCSDQTINLLYRNKWLYKFTPHCRRLKKLCKLVHDHADMVIGERKKALGLTDNQKIPDASALLEKASKSRRLDFLDILLTAVDEKGEGLTDLEIRDEVDAFMFAGYDTTTCSMSFTLYCLAQHPECQQKIREEVNDVLSGRQHLTYDDLKDLKYTQYCIKEAMRLYPPATKVYRQLDSDLEMDGHLFPKGMHFVIGIQTIHTNPDVWPDPMVYDPMRFDPSNSEGRHAYAYIPFSAGPRNCIGQNFAMNEEKVVIANVFRHFNLRVDESHKVVQQSRMVLRAVNDIQVYFEPI